MGPKAVAEAKYFIAGEPTEIDGKIVPMRSHKGRFLADFVVNVAHSGHVSDLVQNALISGAGIVTEIGQYAKVLGYGSSTDEEARIYRPAHSTAQVSAGEVKPGDYSTTPSKVRFSVDMRTLPDVHELRVRELSDLIRSANDEKDGVRVELKVIKDAPGSITEADSSIVLLAQLATGQTARGFNGGDEGRVMRLQAGKEGVTLGPGELRFAHMPDEQVGISSVFSATEIYAKMFRNSASLS